MKRKKNTFGTFISIIGLILSIAAVIARIDATTTTYIIATGVSAILIIEIYRLSSD